MVAKNTGTTTKYCLTSIMKRVNIYTHAHDALISNNHLFVGLNLAVTPKSLNELWRILIRQLNIHENNVKRSSLDLITKLLVAGRVPSQNVRNNLPYYLSSIPLL